MKRYYLKLFKFAGIFLSDYSRVYWGNAEKKKLKATNRGEAIDEALKLFKEHRRLQLKLVDNRFTKDHRGKLKTTFPKKMIIIEEVTYEYHVHV